MEVIRALKRLLVHTPNEMILCSRPVSSVAAHKSSACIASAVSPNDITSRRRDERANRKVGGVSIQGAYIPSKVFVDTCCDSCDRSVL